MSTTTNGTLIKSIILTVAISAVSYPIQAKERSDNSPLYCLIAEKEAEGEWIASRALTISNGAISSADDSYEWRPKESITFGPGMTLKWDIDYHWPSGETAQKVVPEERVAVSLHFWYDARTIDRPLKNPERSWIHLYRSVNPEENFSISNTSLTSIMFWNKFNNGNLSTKAVIPLDHLLAFGAGFDTLVWNIRTEPNQFGGTHAVAKGVIPIAAMRDKVSKIPKLRRLLDKKAANFRDECHAPVVVTSGDG